MEIDVGEYVKLKDGNIRKVSRVDKRQHYTYVYSENGFYHIPLDEIAKHSKNIINLIQEGDYVNGKEIILIDNNIGGLEKSVIYGYKYKDETRLWNIYEKDIKSIVTKEQFSSVEYLLEEE